MLARVTGVFRLARDVEIRYTQGGSAIANVGLVNSSKYKTQAGEQKEDVCFVDATAFGRLGEVMNQYLRKGSKVYIDGQLKLEQWTAQDGSKRSKHTVKIENMEMLDSKQDGQANPNNNMDDPNRHNAGGNMNRPPRNQDPANSGQSSIPEIDINEDEIPFNRGAV